MKKSAGKKAETWISIVGTISVSCFLASAGGFAAVMLMNLYDTKEARTPLDKEASFSGRLGVCNEPFSYTKDKANLYVVAGQLNGKPISYLFDTGASRTSISMAQAQNYGIEINAKSKREVVLTAAGEVDAYLVKDQRIGLAGHQVTTDALLLPGFGEAILGMDVIENFRTTIDRNGLTIIKDC